MNIPFSHKQTVFVYTNTEKDIYIYALQLFYVIHIYVVIVL